MTISTSVQAGLVAQTAAERYDVVPVRGDNHTLYVATSNPLSPTLEREPPAST